MAFGETIKDDLGDHFDDGKGFAGASNGFDNKIAGRGSCPVNASELFVG